MKKIKLFCVPYAGGSAIIYSRWKYNLHGFIELHSVELSGRGKRFGTALHKTMSTMVDDIYNMIRGQLDAQPYALFGYSMGSWVIYELVNKIKQQKHQKPIHVFFSAMEAPHIDRKGDQVVHKLPEVQFKNEIANLGGTPQEILKNNELFNIFSPIIRADYSVIETYQYNERPNKLECDISVLYGKYDTIRVQDVFEWRKHTKGKCNMYEFENGHFFIHDESDKIVNIINDTLSQSVNGVISHTG